MDLETVINSTKREQLVFSDLSDYLFNEIVTTHRKRNEFDYFSVWSWFSLGTGVAAAISLVFILIMHFRMKALYVVVASAGKGHAAQVPTEFVYKATTSALNSGLQMNFDQHMDTLKNFVSVDLTMLIFTTVLLTAACAYWLYQKRQERSIRTSLVFEIGNAKDSQNWTLIGLEFNPSHYKIGVAQSRLTFVLDEGHCSSSLSWEGDGISLINKMLQIPIKLPTRILIKPWNTKRLRNIMARKYYCVLFVSDKTNDIVETAILRQWSNPDDGETGRFNAAYSSLQLLPATSMVAGQQSLYPTAEELKPQPGPPPMY